MARISKEKKQQKRKKILEKSKVLFYTEGYKKTSVKQIAAAAGIAEGTLYNYFDKKSDIFLEIVSNHHYEDYHDETKYLVETGDPAEEIYNYIYIFVSKMLSMPKNILKEFTEISYKMAFSDEKSFTVISEADLAFMEALEQKFKSFIKRKLIIECDIQIYTEIILGIMQFDFLYYTYYSEDETIDKTMERFRKKIDIIMEGITIN